MKDFFSLGLYGAHMEPSAWQILNSLQPRWILIMDSPEAVKRAIDEFPRANIAIRKWFWPEFGFNGDENIAVRIAPTEFLRGMEQQFGPVIAGHEERCFWVAGNEPEGRYYGFTDAWTTEVLKQARDQNRRVAALALSQGNPEDGDWETHFVNTLRELQDGFHVLNLHYYLAWPFLDLNFPYYERLCYLAEAVNRLNFIFPRVIYGEYGVDGTNINGFPGPDWEAKGMTQETYAQLLIDTYRKFQTVLPRRNAAGEMIGTWEVPIRTERGHLQYDTQGNIIMGEVPAIEGACLFCWKPDWDNPAMHIGNTPIFINRLIEWQQGFEEVPPVGGTKNFVVINGPVRIRTLPSLSGEIIGSLNNGQIVTVKTPATESEGYVWWEGQYGWSAERSSDGNEVFMIPEDEIPPPEPPPQPPPEPTPPTWAKRLFMMLGDLFYKLAELFYGLAGQLDE